IGICRRVSHRLGGAGVLHLADAGAVQLLAGPVRVVFLELQGSGEGAVGDRLVSSRPRVGSRRRGARRHTDLLQADARDSDGADWLPAAVAAAMEPARWRGARLGAG